MLKLISVYLLLLLMATGCAKPGTQNDFERAGTYISANHAHARVW